MQKYRGIFHFGKGGDDYVTVTESGTEYDLAVSPGGSVAAFEGDEVEIFTQAEMKQIFSPASGFKKKCRLIGVTARARGEITGEYVISAKTAFLVPDDYIPYRVKIKESPTGIKCSHGDKVLASLNKFKSLSAMRATPLHDFGSASSYGANFRAAVYGSAHFSPFSAAAEKQASSARPHDALNYLNKRRDLRGKTVFTFSDTENCPNSYAFSVSRTDGEWELGLHVADVAEYLEPGSPLDSEAALRGKALFSDRGGSPLFPASFRNSVCGLGSERPVLAVSVLITLDPEGNVLNTDFCESVIDPVLTASACDVDALLSGADTSALMPLRRKYSAVFPSIELLYELAAVLRAARLNSGGVDIDLCDRAFVFDPEKRVTAMSLVPRSDSALMAAELLGAAGGAAAEKLYYAGAGCVYSSCSERRYNEAVGAPAERFLLESEDYFKPGYTAREAAAVRGTPAERYFAAGVSDEFSDAALSFEPKRHYLLNLPKYIRFFDPAERYSDIINLRALKAYIRETPFDVTRYEDAIRAEEAAYPLRRRLIGLFSASYAAQNRGKKLKGIVLRRTVGGMTLLLECGVTAFYASLSSDLPRVGSTVKTEICDVDHRSGTFTLM